MAEALIKLEKVSKTYPGTHTPAVAELDLEIYKGETLVLVGFLILLAVTTVSLATGSYGVALGDVWDTLRGISITRAIDNVVILIEPRNPDDPHLLGLYHGIALTERDSHYGGSLPDTVTIYQGPLEEAFPTPKEIVEQVRQGEG